MFIENKIKELENSYKKLLQMHTKKGEYIAYTLLQKSIDTLKKQIGNKKDNKSLGALQTIEILEKLNNDLKKEAYKEIVALSLEK